MKLKYKLLFLFLLDVFHTFGNTFVFTPNCSKAYTLAFQLRFDEAGNLLQKEQKENPSNAAVHYVGQYIDFLRAFISEEESDFEMLKNKTDNRLNQIEKVDSKNPWKNLARGEMLMQLAIVKLKNKEYLSSGYYLRKSYKLIENNNKEFPGFNANLKSLGFYHAVIGSVPENYKWLASLAGMKGTISQGSSELTRALKASTNNKEMSFMHDEVLFMKLFICTHLEKDTSMANKLISENWFQDPDQSPLSVFVRANTQINGGDFDEALVTLKNYSPLPTTYPLLYLNYMKGMLLLNKLDQSAAGSFLTYVNKYKGNSFIKSAWLKLAWLDLINNNPVGYKQKIDQVILKGNEFTDEDKQAMKEAKSGNKQNIYLLKSRLLFDGGNYNEALAVLAGKPSSDFPTLRDQIEFTYRLARIFDMKGQHEKAVKYYTKTFENGKDQEWYFAANSALLMANYYESINELKTSEAWYKMCLKLRNHEYQNSIDQKAEAGLNRIGKN